MMNSMIPYKQNIFNRIKSFFKRLFIKNKTKIIQEEIEGNSINDVIGTNNKTVNFKEQIMISKDTEKERLLKLRRQWENGEIEENDIDENDVDAIVKIYDEETEQIEQETELIKQDISKMLKKLKESA